MAGRVIQGFFIGATPRLSGTVAAAPISRPVQRRATPGIGPPPPAFGSGQTALQARMAPGRPPLVHASAPVAQRFANGGSTGFAVDPVRLGLARGGGAALPAAILAKMEGAFGADFSGVRVHVGAQASRISALAFATGNDLYFAPGQYQPGTIRGQQLIGHELAHVIQQRQGRVRTPGDGVAVVQDRVLEAEADRLGMRAASYRSAIRPGGAVQRSAIIGRPEPSFAAPGCRIGTAQAKAAGGVVQRSFLIAAAPVVQYTLKTHRSEAKLELMGQGMFYEEFAVSGAATGFVIQRIRRTLDVRMADNPTVPLSIATVENFAACKGNLNFTGWEDYYEMFVITKGEAVHADRFTSAMINPDGDDDHSCGKYTMTGEAYFTTVDPRVPNGNWKVSAKDTLPNGLWAIQNAASATQAELSPPESAKLHRFMEIIWWKNAAAMRTSSVAVKPKGHFAKAAPFQP